MPMEASESLPKVVVKSNAADHHVQSQVEVVKCESCGFAEECTLPYISQIRQHYNGRWICGLCVEAVKYEIMRSDNLITTEEALDRHNNFYRSFRSSSSSDGDDPIVAMGRIMRRQLDSPRGHRSPVASRSRNWGY